MSICIPAALGSPCSPPPCCSPAACPPPLAPALSRQHQGSCPPQASPSASPTQFCFPPLNIFPRSFLVFLDCLSTAGGARPGAPAAAGPPDRRAPGGPAVGKGGGLEGRKESAALLLIWACYSSHPTALHLGQLFVTCIARQNLQHEVSQAAWGGRCLCVLAKPPGTTLPSPGSFPTTPAFPPSSTPAALSTSRRPSASSSLWGT